MTASITGPAAPRAATSRAAIALLASLAFLGATAVRAADTPAPAATTSPEASADAKAEAARNEYIAQIRALPWQKGPGQQAIGTRAHLAIPAGQAMLPESSGSRFLEINGNLPTPGRSILMADDWWAVFGFNDAGYVKDDEKLDADALLKQMQSQDDESNTARREHHLSELHTVGWIVPPHYDSASKQLEWGLRLKSDDSPEPIVNYTMRVLGRHGYESVILVTSPEHLERDVASLRTVLKGFDFDAGEKYSEYRDGDHVAEYGLGALVLGGAAAAAIKGGWFKGLLAALIAGWKLVAAAAVALVAGVRKFFGRSTATK